MNAEKRCVLCGQPVTGRRKLYCSDACARKAHAAHARRSTEGYPKAGTNTLKTCQTCGIVFSGPIKSKWCPSCQRERDLLHDREAKQRKRQGATRALGSTDLCQRCGEPYIVKSGLQRYCPGCAKEATRENIRAHKRAYHAAKQADPVWREQRNARRRAPAPIERTCADCGKSYPSGQHYSKYCPECREKRRKP